MDDGGGKDTLEAQQQHAVPLTEAEIAEQKVMTAEQKREKRTCKKSR